MKTVNKLTAMCAGVVLLAACGASNDEPGEGRSGSGRSDANSTALMAVGSADQLLKARTPLDRYVDSNTLEFDRNVNNIALDAGRVWATTGTNILYYIRPEIEGSYIARLRIDREIDLGCPFGALTPHRDKLWLVQNRCDDGEITLASLDKTTGEVLSRNIITTRNNGVGGIIARDDTLYILIAGGFELLRLPVTDPARIETLDLRPDRDGKYGYGVFTVLDNRIWVVDTHLDQVIEVDRGSFSIISTTPFAQAGINDDIFACVGGSDAVFCWDSRVLQRFDPQTKHVSASWTEDSQILAVAVHGGSVFAGMHGGTAELDARNLDEKSMIAGLYSRNLQIGPLP
jgi:hypothetical protein